MSQIHIDLQIACKEKIPISEDCLILWISTVLMAHDHICELTLRLVDLPEITNLNKTYRKLNKPTNVLAFPSDIPDIIPMELPFLGDIIICPQVLQEEASSQNIPLIAHWAHIVIHGALHLLGYDHIKKTDEKVMQDKEITLLLNLGFNNPYCFDEPKGH